MGKKITAFNLNDHWSKVIMEEWCRLGVELFVISPGSRSTPLALNAVAQKKARSIIHFDERGAGFLALGWAKASGKPAVLICTSGTALTHYLPAIVEAKQSRIPLIVMSADRPPELQEVAANQTIEQQHIFGKQVHHYLQFACPSEAVPIEYILSQIDNAFYQATRIHTGPVHINCPFREPLSNQKQRYTLKVMAKYKEWERSTSPYTLLYDALDIKTFKEITNDLYLKKNAIDLGTSLKHLADPKPKQIDSELAAVLGKGLAKAKKPLILIGQLSYREKRDLSQISHTNEKLKKIGVYGETDLLNRWSIHLNHFSLWADKLSAKDRPDCVIHVGGKIISKPIHQLLSRFKGRYIQINDSGGDTWHDPEYIGGIKLRGEVEPLLDFCLAGLTSVQFQYAAKLKNFDESCGKNLAKVWRQTLNLNEPYIANHLNVVIDSLIDKTYKQKYKIPKERQTCCLYLGNSMPVRDFIHYSRDIKASPVLVNRGASGIDGQLASAYGALCHLKTPGLILLGDLSVLHDLNSLSLYSKVEEPVIILVINNDGGGIFHYLPVYNQSQYFQKVMRTPHGYHFKHIAKQFNLNYQLIQSTKEFENINIPNKGAMLLELVVDPKDNLIITGEVEKVVKKN